jgi:hypothetical protein
LGEQNSHFHDKKTPVFRVNSATGRLLCELLDLFRQGIQLSVENPPDLLKNPGLFYQTQMPDRSQKKSYYFNL